MRQLAVYTGLQVPIVVRKSKIDVEGGEMNNWAEDGKRKREVETCR